MRRAFLNADELQQRIRKFRMDRLALIGADEGPLGLVEGRPKLVIHVIPAATFTDDLFIDINSTQTGLSPLGATGWNSLHSLDGLVTYSGPEDDFATVRAFTTLFHNGAAEAVDAIYTGSKDGHSDLDLNGVEEDLIAIFRSILPELSRLGVPQPVYIAVSILGVRGFSAPLGQWGRGLAFPQRQDRILLPEFRVEKDTDGKWDRSGIKPACDMLWTAFGKPGSPNFTKDGHYQRRP